MPHPGFEFLPPDFLPSRQSPVNPMDRFGGRRKMPPQRMSGFYGDPMSESIGFPPGMGDMNKPGRFNRRGSMPPPIMPPGPMAPPILPPPKIAPQIDPSMNRQRGIKRRPIF